MFHLHKAVSFRGLAALSSTREVRNCARVRHIACVSSSSLFWSVLFGSVWVTCLPKLA